MRTHHLFFVALALTAYQARAQTAPTAQATPPAAPPAQSAPAATAPQAQATSPIETPAPTRHRRPLAEAFAQANTTHDGHLTVDQAKAAKMYNIVKRFPEIDKDHKGYVTEDEIRSYYRALREARRAKEHAPDGPKS